MKRQKLETFLIPRLRRISLWWRGRNEAYKAAKETIEVGTYKNGKPILKVVYRCAHCEELFDRKNVQADHIVDIANINGFTNWNDYITKLFCEKEGFQILCIDCHFLKSQYEKSIRNNIQNNKPKK